MSVVFASAPVLFARIVPLYCCATITPCKAWIAAVIFVSKSLLPSSAEGYTVFAVNKQGEERVQKFRGWDVWKPFVGRIERRYSRYPRARLNWFRRSRRVDP